VDAGLNRALSCVACSYARDILAVLADVVGGDIGVELADAGEDDVAHDRIAKLFGEYAEVGGPCGVVGARDDLGEELAAETCDIGSLGSAVGTCDGLSTDDVELSHDNAVPVAERVEAGVFVEEAGEKLGGEIGAVGLIDEASPGVGVEAADSFAEGGMLIEAFCAERGEAERHERGVIEGLMCGDGEVVLPTGGMGR
jgi:hypothetical protein